MRDLIADLQTRLSPKWGRILWASTMDNLNIHKHRLILNLIRNAGYRVVFRAPYWSRDGAIEYFNTIHTYLEMDDGQVMENVAALVIRIILINGSMASFGNHLHSTNTTRTI
jgi:hypothetical protein